MWRTKQDVLNDLAEYSGIQINDFDDEYIVRGGKPPPPSRIEDDSEAEISLRFGKSSDFNAAGDPGPDLAGITRMLRMVKSYDETDEPNESQKKNEIPEPTIVISKLNPNVKEFIPKTVNLVENGKIKNGISENGEKKENLKLESNVNVLVDAKVVTADEIEKKHTMNALHKTIIQANQTNGSLEQKRAKNVAIMALLKLHSGPAVPTAKTSPEQPETPDPPKPLVLFTPDYYAGVTSSPANDSIDKEEEKIPELLLTPKSTPSPNEIADPIVKDSISKVENWLKSPEKKVTKPAAPYIGPVTFRKKDTPSTSSPVSEVGKENKKIYSIPAYVPSKYAEDLRKQFEENVKAKEEKQKKDRYMKMNMWDKLELELKERDEVIRNRMRLIQLENSPDSNN